MIDYIVIVACGKGTRLSPLTNHIPKILVNLNNDNILSKIVLYWKLYCKKFIILINEEYNTYINFYLSDYTDITYKIRNIEIKNNEENSYTIKKCLYDFDNLSLLITWCDVFPNEPIDFNKINTNCIFVNNYYNYKSRYSAKEPNIIKKEEDYNKGNIIGIYYFKSYKTLINNNDKEDLCDCYLINYDNFQTYEINDIIDIGDIEKLKLYLINKFFNTRYFNTITRIDNNTIQKSSNCLYGNNIIQKEILFYKYISDNNIDYPLEKIYNDTEYSFCMKYINKNTLYETILKEKNKGEIFNILSCLKNLHTSNEKNVEPDIIKNDLYLETIIKIKERYENVSTILNSFSHIKYVNNIKIDSYENILKKVNIIIDNFINKNSLKYNIIHGDLNLSNIFKISDAEFRFIDPRGYFGKSTIYGLKYYELSKIYLSLFGYDAFNNNNEYCFNIINDNIYVNINLLFENIFIYDKVYTHEEYQFIICLAISVWLGIPYYFKSNISKLIGSHFYSLYLATIYLESIDTLIANKTIESINRTYVIIKNSESNQELYFKNNREVYKQEFETYRRLIVNKPWGYEFVCSEFDNVSMLVLHIKNGEETSFHAHSEKDTPMILAQGVLKIKTVDNEYTVNVGEIVILNRRIFHKLCSYGDTILLEFEMMNPNKNDLIRYKDKYNREDKKYESKEYIVKDALFHKDYFEYYEDTVRDTFKKFKDSYIVFKRGAFDTTIICSSIIVILKGQININGIYMNCCSILKGSDIIGKNILYLTKDFIYMKYDLNNLIL